MCISCNLIEMILYSPSSKRCDSCWPPTARDRRSLLYRRGATQYCKLALIRLTGELVDVRKGPYGSSFGGYCLRTGH